MTEISLHDYFGRHIQWKNREFYYKNGMLSPESMQEYEKYKEKIIEESEKVSKFANSLKSKIYEEKDKLLDFLNKKKWGSNSNSASQ